MQRLLQSLSIGQERDSVAMMYSAYQAHGFIALEQSMPPRRTITW
jgi:hypothetical protein